MRATLSTLIFLALFSLTAFAGDKVQYINGGGFVKTRQVSEIYTYASVTLGTTSTFVTFPKDTLSLLIENTHGSNDIYVNPTGGVAFNLDNDDTASTTAGSNIIDLNDSVTNEFGEVVDLGEYLPIGTFVILDEGNANDGLYTIIAKVEGNKVRLNRELAVTSSYTQDYTLSSIKVEAGGTLSINVGTQTASIMASGASTIVNITAGYQKEG